jgi:hypothetical protein
MDYEDPPRDMFLITTKGLGSAEELRSHSLQTAIVVCTQDEDDR